MSGMDIGWDCVIGKGVLVNHGWGMVTGHGVDKGGGIKIGIKFTLFHGVTIGMQHKITAKGE